jgi:hypothetical protein
MVRKTLSTSEAYLRIQFYSLTVRETRFTKEPSDEEVAEMDKLTESSRGKTKAEVGDDLKVKAEALSWDLSSRDGMRQAAKDMIELLTSGSTKGKTINIPKENVMQSVGKVRLTFGGVGPIQADRGIDVC